MKNYKNTGLGVLEAALFMPGFDARLPAGRPDARGSFLIPLFLLPFSIVILISVPPDVSVSAISACVLGIMYVVRFCLYLSVFLGLGYILAQKLGQAAGFRKFIIAHNGLILAPFLLMMPLQAAFAFGVYTWAEIYPMMVMFWLYGYGCIGFAAMRIFRLPCEFGIAVGMAALAIHQTSLTFVKYVFAQAFLALA